jgi:exonuclease III
MLQWNSNSISHKKYELEHFLTINQIDIAAVSETKLSPRRKLQFPEYSIYRQDRNQQGGGVLLLVKNGLHHDSIHITGITALEQVAVMIHSPPDRRILIVSGYNPQTRRLVKRSLKLSLATTHRSSWLVT